MLCIETESYEERNDGGRIYKSVRKKRDVSKRVDDKRVVEQSLQKMIRRDKCSCN